MKIGVLALQGDFAEHVFMLGKLGMEPVEVRLPAQLDDLRGLIIPGGESTTFGKLAVRFGLMEPLQKFIDSGRAVWGTCAGMIFLARDVGRDQPTLARLNVRVKRNAFGRQLDSFTAPINVKGLDTPFEAVFIRAPVIEEVGSGVEVLAQVHHPSGQRIVAARQGNMLATSFHPELTGDTRMHASFLKMV